MKSILKQVIGIDVAQKELVVAAGRLLSDLSKEIYAHRVFANSEKGFAEMLAWVKKLTDVNVSLQFIMEATGVYHEKLAYYLTSKNHKVSIILPNKISSYMRTLDIKTVTDKSCSEAITRFGLERSLEEWKQPSPIYRKIKQLTREREQIVEERTVVKNQKHAEETEAYPNKSSLKRMQERIKMLIRQEKEIKEEIAVLIAKDEETQRVVNLLCTIPGIGQLTAAIILAETNGFELVRSRRQLASYAGLDIREKQSGTSVKGKPTISKRGNKYLRKAMHLPALCAIRYNEKFKMLFGRLVSKHGIKMKAAVAVQRKQLELAYTLFKNNSRYKADYKGEL